jgi:hypothetical protein
VGAFDKIFCLLILLNLDEKSRKAENLLRKKLWQVGKGLTQWQFLTQGIRKLPYNIYAHEFQSFWLYVPSTCLMFFLAFADLL